MKLQGEITSWNDARGYGFITPESGGDRIFVHVTAIRTHRQQRPQLNQTVYYTPSQNKDGKPCAIHVTSSQHAASGVSGSARAFIIAGVFFGALAGLTYIFQIIPLYILALYALMSVITYLVYATDKAAAKKGRWRTPESTLHGLSLFGGWPGALIAQQTLHHKSRKVSFQWMYKFTVLLNIAVTTWFLTPRGRELTMALLKKLSS
jgi:uncharacterized membrane protein YsdA (DUF1294 family)/cold shock CspA family protein